MNLRLVALKVVGVLVLAAAGVALGEAAPRPNNVLITADNQGFHHTGCYGNREIKTPNIDRLARQSVRCTSFYSASPTCTWAFRRSDRDADPRSNRLCVFLSCSLASSTASS